MRKLAFLMMVVFAVAAIGTTGCPGKKTTATDKGGTGTSPGGGGGGDDSFTLAHNAKDSQNIKQGEVAKIKVSVTRQKHYKQGDEPIVVDAKVTKGDVTVEPASQKLKADEDHYDLKITAKADAKVDSEYEVAVKASGPHGKTGELTIKGKILAK